LQVLDELRFARTAALFKDRGKFGGLFPELIPIGGVGVIRVSSQGM